MRETDLQLLRCPRCLGGLNAESPLRTTKGGRVKSGQMTCQECAETWQISNNFTRLYKEQDVRGPDRVMRRFYDGLPSLHNAAVRYLLPVMQLGGSEEELRGAYMQRLELGALQPRTDRPIRILEVGVGAGANLDRMRALLPSGLDVEIWGLDLSEGMLNVCRRQLARGGHDSVRLLMGDAHALPFESASFDRVFHVGGIGGFNDPGLALSEMARVAVPGTPIVVVDEQLDAKRPAGPYTKLMFWAVTFYDDNPHCPVELLPAGAEDVLEEQISRFYYSLRFRAAGASNGASNGQRGI
jgi:ubiquinone/menaquinone biosynthesis C-methylase UbiE